MLFKKSYQAPLVYVSITMQDLLFCPLLETLGVVNITTPKFNWFAFKDQLKHSNNKMF